MSGSSCPVSKTHVAPRIAVLNLGCRLNRVEMDLIAEDILDAGCKLVEEVSADAIVVNTCAVTAEAEAKTRKAIRHAASLPQRPLVIATGCVASLFADELTALAENVKVEANKARVAGRLFNELGWSATAPEEGLWRMPTPTGRMRRGIKIQDGCNNRCTYCIVWKARGAAHSIDPARVVLSVQEAVAHGSREIVLSGINLGSYDWVGSKGHLRLPELIELILRQTDVGRLRLSSIEPLDISDQLLSVMASSGERVAPFLHACLQSGCDETLRRMGRIYTTDQYRHVIAQARSAVQALSVGCDVIVGFPGETDKDFEESLSFCKEMGFARMHVFRFSRRPGTPAATMAGQVPPEVLADRSKRMRALAQDMRVSAANAHICQVESVLVQAPGRGVTGGLFDILLDRSLPVDTLVHVVPHRVVRPATLDARLGTPDVR